MRDKQENQEKEGVPENPSPKVPPVSQDNPKLPQEDQLPQGNQLQEEPKEGMSRRGFMGVMAALVAASQGKVLEAGAAAEGATVPAVGDAAMKSWLSNVAMPMKIIELKKENLSAEEMHAHMQPLLDSYAKYTQEAAAKGQPLDAVITFDAKTGEFSLATLKDAGVTPDTLVEFTQDQVSRAIKHYAPPPQKTEPETSAEKNREPQSKDENAHKTRYMSGETQDIFEAIKEGRESRVEALIRRKVEAPQERTR